MKQIRQYKMMPCGEWSFQTKTTYLLDRADYEYFSDMWENNRRRFDDECRYMLDAYDAPSRFDGDRYERFEFYLTSPGRVTMVHRWGIDA